MTMSDHPTLFGVSEGRRLRDRSLRLIDTATRFDPWRNNAERAVRYRVALGEPFSANEIREDVGAPPRPNMFGSLFKWAERSALVEWKGEMTPSNRPEAHARLTKLWHPKRRREAS
jgi:hypothetical protein